MPPFRMPNFGRKPHTVNGIVVDENQPPTGPQYNVNGVPMPSKSPVMSSVVGGEQQRRPSAININQKKDQPEEFKLGIVNDSGVYLPPSPPERKSMWKRTPTSTTTSSHRSMLSETDGFSISRESFESYRRSFDISARSPVIHAESSYSRQSLDSARTPNTPRSIRQHSNRSFELSRPPKTLKEEQEEAVGSTDVFEDVGLDDAAKLPAKKGIFSRFMNNEGSNSTHTARPGSGHANSRFHLPGRKRGQSGQGAELGDIPRSPHPVSLEESGKESEDVESRS